MGTTKSEPEKLALVATLKKDTYGSKGLYQVKQGDDGSPGTRGLTRSIPKPALKKDPHRSKGLHAVKQGDDVVDPHLKKTDPPLHE
jgi:hypothetical protein